MKIGILQCDDVHKKFASLHGQYPEMFVNLLHRADPFLEFNVYDVQRGNLPAHIDECDGYLITGSRHGVNDDFPWIQSLVTLVLNLHQAEKKIIGICFGHQLIAKALGGKVIKSPNGWGIGMSTNEVKQKKHWMDPSREQFKLLVSHQDQVVELPEKAEILAGSEFCPFYMMQIENNLLTVQGHPEFSKAYSQALIEDRVNILSKETYEQGLESLQMKVDDALIAQWIVNFLHG